MHPHRPLPLVSRFLLPSRAPSYRLIRVRTRNHMKARESFHDSQPASSDPDTASRQAMASLMGLAIFGEKVAARTYVAMADLRVEHGDLLRRFAAMQARHGASFLQVSRANAVEPDREFADRELGYLIEQVERHARASDF